MFHLHLESKVWRCSSQAGEGEKSPLGKGKSTEPRHGARRAVLYEDLSTDWIVTAGCRVPHLNKGIQHRAALLGIKESRHAKG